MDAGAARIDWRAVVALAAPMIANNSIQAVLNLTDTWFIGRLSTDALAAIGAVQWLVFVAIMLFGGVGLAVQTVVAQAFGARRFGTASRATWRGVWTSLATAPIFVALGLAGRHVLTPFGLDAHVTALALQFWQPRIGGGCLAVTMWALLGFFNGIGKTTVALWINVAVGAINIVLNQLFIFDLGWGIAGSAWATNCAMLIGCGVAAAVFLGERYRPRYRSRYTWRTRADLLLVHWRLGFPMGLMIAADMIGVALFQIMQVRHSAVDGAATQVVMMLTSIAYMPTVGIALSGTTLVGQAIGAGDRDWALRIGNAIVWLACGYMASIGLLLGLSGPWLVPLFVGTHDAQAAQVVALGVTLIWIGGAYQAFDGLNIASGCCLRGAGDATVPAVMVTALSWGIFVPLAYMATFNGDGWFALLPQFGFGAVGGWTALLVYIVLLGLAMLWRWRARAWQRIAIS